MSRYGVLTLTDELGLRFSVTVVYDRKRRAWSRPVVRDRDGAQVYGRERRRLFGWLFSSSLTSVA